MVGERQGQIVSVGFQWRKRARFSRDVKIPRIFQSEEQVWKSRFYFHLGSICQGWNWTEQHEFRTCFARRIDQAKSNGGLGPFRRKSLPKTLSLFLSHDQSILFLKIKTLLQIHPNLSNPSSSDSILISPCKKPILKNSIFRIHDEGGGGGRG